MAQLRIPEYIPRYGKSYAMLAHDPNASTAVVFVHGLGGKPTETWVDFHQLSEALCSDYPWWTTSDMFFYGYESIHTSIRRNADILNSFLQDVGSGNWRSQRGMAKRTGYKNTILAGHSEGAVIIRRLVLDRFEGIEESVRKSNPRGKLSSWKSAMRSEFQADLILDSHLSLFAPACRGTNFSSWVGFMTSFSHFVNALTATKLVRNELLPDSPVLTTLRIGTERAHAEFPEIRSLYTRPLFGDPDQIVYSESYQGEQPIFIVDHDHFTICKPNFSYRTPLEFVKK
jgi:pimeloyl-ACP methyl ester carboxylesterase